MKCAKRASFPRTAVATRATRTQRQSQSVKTVDPSQAHSRDLNFCWLKTYAKVWEKFCKADLSDDGMAVSFCKTLEPNDHGQCKCTTEDKMRWFVCHVLTLPSDVSVSSTSATCSHYLLHLTGLLSKRHQTRKACTTCRWCGPLPSWAKNRSRHHQCQAETPLGNTSSLPSLASRCPKENRMPHRG